MTRFTRPAGVERNLELDIALLIGPVQGDALTDEDLRVGWHFYGEQVMDEYNGPRCSRPWGWWQFEAGEDMPREPGAETIRLAELGELTDDELAALRERANEARLRIDTDRERVSGGSLKYGGCAVVSHDRRDVELFEAVCAARGGNE